MISSPLPCSFPGGFCIGPSTEKNKRELILNYISENPGATFRHLEEFFGYSRSTLRYHLDHLERRNRIRRTREGGNVRFHRVGSPAEGYGDLKGTQKRLFRIILGEPGIGLDRIIELSPASKERTRRALRSLMVKDLVVEYGDRSYRVIDRDEIRKRIYIRLVKDLVSGRIDEATFLELTSDL